MGPYRILERIGIGGMGEVYRALDLRLDRLVAVKFLLPGADEERRRRFEREARAAATVNHPGICAILDVGQLDGDPWFAMELLQGESLADRLARGPLPVADALHLGSQVLTALEELHRRGFVHRDLKPSNLFLTPHGTKVLDLGLAAPLEGSGWTLDGRLTASGTILGTPYYMSPEQWEGSPVSPATDLFSLGVVLFEALTGQLPFNGPTPFAIYEAVLRCQPPVLTGGPGIEGLDRFLHRALSKRPLDRFPDAGSMRRALDSLQLEVRATGAQTFEFCAVRAVTRLAVLPFSLPPQETELESLGYPLAEAVASRLATHRQLLVRSPAATREFAETTPNLRAIYRELQVDAVLTGSWLRAGDRLRLSIQVLELPEGNVAWSAVAEPEVRDLFALVEDLARQVSDAFALSASPPGSLAGRKGQPASSGCYARYLQAVELGRKTSSAEALLHARDALRECTEEDPNFSPAWAQLGRVWRILGKYGHAARSESRQRARRAFERALALDPESALAHNLYTYFEVEDLGSPVSAMQRLLGRLASGYPDAELAAGLVVACRFCGLLEASLAAHERAVRLDPTIHTSVAYTLWMTGAYLRAHEADRGGVAFVKLYSLPMLQREEEAIRAYERWHETLSDGLELALGDAARGALLEDRQLTTSAVRRLLDQGFSDAEGLYFLARNLVRCGEHDMGLVLLERVLEGGFTLPRTLRNDPWLAPVRSDERFQEILGRAAEAHRHAWEVFRQADGPRLLGVDLPTQYL